MKKILGYLFAFAQISLLRAGCCCGTSNQKGETIFVKSVVPVDPIYKETQALSEKDRSVMLSGHCLAKEYGCIFSDMARLKVQQSHTHYLVMRWGKKCKR